MPKITAATVAEHRERTYEALLDAVDALVVERGFDAVSMRDIAARAGVARTAIYNYATDKASLLIAAAERGAAGPRAAVAEVAGDVTMSAPERLDAIVRLLLVSFADSTRNLLILRAVRRSLTEAQKEQAIAPFRNDVGVHIARVIQDGIASGDYAPTGDVELTVELMIGVMEAAVERVVNDPSVARTTATAAAAFLHGALSHPATSASRR